MFQKNYEKIYRYKDLLNISELTKIIYHTMGKQDLQSEDHSMLHDQKTSNVHLHCLQKSLVLLKS